jgi:hypothetical protein
MANGAASTNLPRPRYSSPRICAPSSRRPRHADADAGFRNRGDVLCHAPVWFTVRPPVAVLLAPIALVQEPLVVALQLIIEDDPLNPAVLAAKAPLGALIGAVDLRVVRELAALPDAGVEGLAGFMGALVTLVTVRREQVTSAVRQRHGAIVRAERARPNQSLALEVSSAAMGIAGIVAQVVQITLGYNPKCADGRQHTALGAVDLIDTVALTNGSALASTWEIEVLREYVTRVTFLVPIAIVRAAAATEVAVPGIVTIALAVPGIVPVPHVSILSTSCRLHFSGIARGRSASASMESRVTPLQPIVGLRRLS